VSRKHYATTWQDLAGKIAPEILLAPKTVGDKHTSQNGLVVDTRTVRYLDRNIVGKAWDNHLALAIAVLTAANRDARTIYMTIVQLHNRFKAIFPALKLLKMGDWDPTKHIPIYLEGKIVPQDTVYMRTHFVGQYISTSKVLEEWINSLPPTEQQTYQPFILPRSYLQQFDLVQNHVQLKQQAQTKRKMATDAIVPYFADLRAEVHLRHNKLARLLQAYENAIDEMKKSAAALPFCFSFEEGAERLHFRIWDHRTFVLSYPEHFPKSTLSYAEHCRRTFAAGKDRLFLELVAAETLSDRNPSEGYWFVDLLRKDLLGNTLNSGSKDEIAAKLKWSRQWGYADERAKTPESPFETRTAGLLYSEEHPRNVRRFQSITHGVIIPVQSLYDGATFGLLAITLFTTTGMRSNEALQIRLSEDCFFRVSKAAPPGAKDKSPRIRYGFRLIPKGERRDVPQDYFIGEETKELLVITAKMLKEHYGLPDGEPLPLVPFSRSHTRMHRFGKARYLFQYHHHHLTHYAMNACIRFLTHGMVFINKDGKNIIPTPHLLRHAFATYAAHVEKLPIDVIGAMLHHKNLDVTEYYSRPTESIVANWQDTFLDSLAAHINLDEAILRVPESLQEQLVSALDRTGTVHQTLGGDCTLHSTCPIQFACIGCAANVPDPARRYQVEREQQHAAAQVQLATDEGRLPDAQRWRQYGQRCAAFLKEMDMIEAYRKDSTHSVTIQFQDIQRFS